MKRKIVSFIFSHLGEFSFVFSTFGIFLFFTSLVTGCSVPAVIGLFPFFGSLVFRFLYELCPVGEKYFKEDKP